MKKFFNAIYNFFKNILGQDVNVSIEKNVKYDVKKNKNCNIAINDGGDNNERK